MKIPSFLRDRLHRSPLALLPAGVVLGLTAWVFVVFNDNFLHRDYAYDESYFTWGGWCILKGLVPYRDFLEFKPPLLFLTHALALKFYGFGAFQYRWFFLWFPMASVLALQASMLSRGIDKLATTALGLALVQLWVNPHLHDTSLSDSESIGLAYYFLGVAFLLARTRFGASLKIPGAALLAACALSKEPFLPSAALTGVCAFVVDARPGTLGRDFARYARATGAGLALLLGGLCVWMIPSGAMRAYVETFSKYMRLYRDPARSYCVALGRVHPTTPLHDLYLQGQQALVDFINLPTLGYLIPFAVVAVAFTAWRSRVLLAATLATMALSFYSVTASNCQWMHYYLLSENGLFFFLVIGLDSMTVVVRRIFVRRLIGAALLGTAVWACWPRYDIERRYIGTRTFHDPYRELVTGSLETIAHNTTPTDRVFTTGPPLLYPQSDRVSATRESTFVDEGLGFYDGANDVERLSGIRAQLEQNMPKVFVTDPENSARKVRHTRALIQPFLTEHQYREVHPNVWLRPY